MRKGPFVGKCTRYLGSGVTGDFVWMVAYPEMKLQYVRTIWVRIVLGCGRDVWVRMSHRTLGGYYVYARRDYGTYVLYGFRY